MGVRKGNVGCFVSEIQSNKKDNGSCKISIHWVEFMLNGKSRKASNEVVKLNVIIIINVRIIEQPPNLSVECQSNRAIF